jgi:peptidoglycan glycosyltransferase
VNTNIRRLSAVFTIIFALITIDLVYYQVIDAGALATDSHNPRAYNLAEQVVRGRFYDTNGRLLVGRWRRPDGFVQPIYKDPSLAQTLGYHSVTYSDTGLQATQSSYLTGQRGTNWGQVMNSWEHRPVTGDDVHLTIDERVQQAAVQGITSSLAENGLDANTPAAAVAFNPVNGHVLAIVSKPYYNPTCLDSELLANRTSCFNNLKKIPGVHNVQASPLLNRVTNGLFPPGSIFKTITLSAGLDSGAAKLSDEFTGTAATGPYSIDGFTLSNATSNLPPGTTSASLLQAFTWSDNIVYAQIGLKVGWPGLLRYANGYLFGQNIPFDIPVTASSILAKGEPKNRITLATSSFGQGHDLVTPLQMMLVAGAVDNGGRIALPMLVKSVTAPGGSVVHQNSTRTVDTAISQATAQKMKYAMEQVVTGYYGSGFEAAIPGATVGGKTGTAQTGNPNQLDTWFISWAQQAGHKVAVAVVVQAPSYCPGLGAQYDGSVCEGAYVAAPVAKTIMQAALAAGE